MNQTKKTGCTFFQKWTDDFERETHFFSTSHIQPDVPEGYVPISFQLRSKEQVIESFLYNSTEIPNPNPEFQG